MKKKHMHVSVKRQLTPFWKALLEFNGFLLILHNILQDVNNAGLEALPVLVFNTMEG